ncbi:hypothetical protein EYC59_01560 [Candidatus Saccharibacteria bacterium]|nr:MAG: hypothetical protein EYC59_01560 [Candidatus Saccharibacteria bacterium]
MGTPEDTLVLPAVRCDEELWQRVGNVYVSASAAADRLARFGLTPQQIGATTIHFSAEEEPEGLDIATGYDAENATLTLYPMTAAAPKVSQNSPPRRSRRIPTGSRPEKYFEERSDELSGLLAGMLVLYAVDAGYRSEEMRRKQVGHSLWRGVIYTVATGVGVYGVYQANESGITEPTGGFIATVCGVVAVVGFAAWGGHESRRQEKEERNTIAEREALEAYQAAPPDLVRITPPSRR